MSDSLSNQNKQRRTKSSLTNRHKCDWKMVMSAEHPTLDYSIVTIVGEHKPICGTDLVKHHHALDAYTSACVAEGISRRKGPSEIAEEARHVALETATDIESVTTYICDPANTTMPSPASVRRFHHLCSAPNKSRSSSLFYIAECLRAMMRGEDTQQGEAPEDVLVSRKSGEPFTAPPDSVMDVMMSVAHALPPDTAVDDDDDDFNILANHEVGAQ